MLNFSIIWDLAFSSFEMFVGIGIIWLLWIEPLFPSRSVSVPIMIVVAVAGMALNFYWGYRKIRLQWNKGQAQIHKTETTEIEYEGEIV